MREATTRRIRTDESMEGRIVPILFRKPDPRRAGGWNIARVGASVQDRARRLAETVGRNRRFNAVDAENAVTPGVRNEMIGAYMETYENLEQQLQQFAIVVTQSNKREEIQAYPEAAPYPARQDRHRGPKTKSFAFRQYRIRNYAYALRIPYHVDDVDDDLTGSLLSMARQGGEHFGSLDERILIQMITGATDSDLLPSVPLAPDGAAIYAATAGGADRFGVSGGNVGAGVADPNAADIRGMYQDSLAFFRKAQNTEGQPWINPSRIKQGLTILHGPSLERQMKEAFKQQFVLESISGTALAAPSNVILDSGEKVTLYSTPRITTDALYIFLNGAPIRPITKQVRREMYTVKATEANSDSARDTNEEYDQYRMRMGWGVNLTVGTFSFTNA